RKGVGVLGKRNKAPRTAGTGGGQYAGAFDVEGPLQFQPPPCGATGLFLRGGGTNGFSECGGHLTAIFEDCDPMEVDGATGDALGDVNDDGVPDHVVATGWWLGTEMSCPLRVYIGDFRQEGAPPPPP